jgi:hypothetical protein
VDPEALHGLLARYFERMKGIIEMHGSAGRRHEAVAAWRETLDRFERKGAVPLVRRVREKLAALQAV